MLQILKYCDMNSLSATRDICHMGRGRSQIPLIDSNYHFLLEGTQTTISGSARMMNMDSNVAAMKGWLMEKVEADWNSATRENSDSNLDLGRGTKPRIETSNAMSKEGRDSVSSHVSRHVRSLTSTFFAFDE